MRMLEKDEEVEVEVTAEDQASINAFSRFTARIGEIEAASEKSRTEKEYLEDLSTELELADEDEPVRYRIGDAFVHLSLSEAQERLEKDQAKWDAEVERCGAAVNHANEQLSLLKTKLYAKFGNAINLEK